MFMNTILHQTKSEFEFNYIYVIESLDTNEGDTLTGKNLLENLKPYADQAKALSTGLITVESAAQFWDAMDYICQKAAEGERPVIHFEIHGTDEKDGLYIKNGDVIEWPEVLYRISDINYASGCNLMVSFAVCYGQYLAQFINATKKMPFCISLGSFEELYEDDLEVRFFAFYKELLASFNIDKAYKALLLTMSQVKDKMKEISILWNQVYEKSISSKILDVVSVKIMKSIIGKVWSLISFCVNALKISTAF